ncbi:MAG: hypothetical protein AAF645_07475 [Myxococcota bacterium]
MRPTPVRPAFNFPPLTPLVKTLLFVLWGCFIAQAVLVVWLDQEWPLLLMLEPVPSVRTAWQLFTYPFLSTGDPLAMAISSLFFWWVVSPFEMRFGKPHTLKLLAVITVLAAIPVLIAGTILGGGRITIGPLVSVHAHIVGAIAAFAWAHRFGGTMSIFGMFTLTAKQVIAALVLWSALYFLATRDITNLLADIGAVGAGVFYIERLSRPPKQPKKKSVDRKGLKVIRGGGGGSDDDDPPKWLN